MTEPTAPCPICGRRVPSYPQRLADGRLDTVESWVRTAAADDLVPIVRWLDHLLATPPLDRRKDPACLLLAALANDLEERIRVMSDDDSALPALLGDPFDRPPHDAAAGPPSTIEELRASLGGPWA